MLAFVVRGVILFGVLSWYSATVWRVIDGYFQDQFRAYLRDEYRQHPRMRADIESARNVDKGLVPDALPAEPSPSRGIEEIYAPDAATRRARTTTTTKMTTPADIADACRAAIGRKPEKQVAGGTSENAVAVCADKNAFSESAVRSALLQSRKPPRSGVHGEVQQPGTINQDADREQGTTEGRSEVVLALSPRSWRGGSQGDSGTRGVPSGMSQQRMSWKRGAHAVVRQDFAGARTDSDDFSEFEEEEEEEEDREFLKEEILVSELPFKPRADIGDLARVTAKEFCPLTPDDEASCEEITTWP